jgi:hypothetical protein
VKSGSTDGGTCCARASTTTSVPLSTSRAAGCIVAKRRACRRHNERAIVFGDNDRPGCFAGAAYQPLGVAGARSLLATTMPSAP